ncbi:dipeptide/oligopeptide/nickel ABC transporter permease/ATP-binding protein [Rhodococcus fascians]|nr:dipeptide/oligopeptide/nickel ABC transporter permease/ATP-binding protein [Rhodococcus fascians]MBY3826608.1 dipeptide/oligopeptide/nickel ABC transporter permease/ATP-binding protein [Rhodococcus fascians]MBY3837069.1 dipeptide/oligopeptide/nickel ABC transporter permease/ATP-binding protein [Rhodococcus fascians]MBY3865464.1 dipeptide/oligopeptide/nickel ABC transporter permease/ATP-binding protein [Rhodococcus fascians]MBY3885750.1 dipeptide/oligopeptide/nickel ABC transporter permease/A
MAETHRRMPAPLIAGLVMLGILVLTAILAPVFLSSAANTLTTDTRATPSAEHWFGTDDLGRDILARSLVAARLTLVMAAAATAMAVVAGVLVGALVWLAPRRVRESVLRVIDSTVAFPSIILALVIAAVLGPATSSAIIAIGVAGIPGFARITSNMTASVAQKDFVGTARLLGVPGWMLFVRHLLPNIGGPLLVLIASSFALSLLDISSLSFVGLGVQSPDYDWGRLLNEGLPAIYSQPMAVAAPAAMLIFAGVAAMLTGDGLAARIDPWGRQPRLARKSQSAAATSLSPAALVEVRDLKVTAANGTQLVKGIDFDIAPGEILGLVGESGSGKSMTAMSLARLHPDSVAVDVGLMRLGDLDLRSCTQQSRLAKEIGLVYQDPGSTFNPALRLGVQLTEVARVHLGMSRAKANATLVEALRGMRIKKPEERMTQHPYQLSGGMLQRAIIASSLVTNPTLIIADEPTTALDVTVQAEVLRQLKQINSSEGTAILFISHDIGVVEAFCDRVLVMQQGEIVERLTGAQLAARDVRHPYTRALLAATPTISLPTISPATPTLATEEVLR